MGFVIDQEPIRSPMKIPKISSPTSLSLCTWALVVGFFLGFLCFHPTENLRMLILDSLNFFGTFLLIFSQKLQFFVKFKSRPCNLSLCAVIDCLVADGERERGREKSGREVRRERRWKRNNKIVGHCAIVNRTKLLFTVAKQLF